MMMKRKLGVCRPGCREVAAVNICTAYKWSLVSQFIPLLSKIITGCQQFYLLYPILIHILKTYMHLYSEYDSEQINTVGNEAGRSEAWLFVF